MEKSTKQLTRRSFLKTTAAVVGAASVATSIGCTSGAESGETDQPAAPEAEERVFANWCRGNCGNLSVCCLDTVVREGKIVSTRQHPVKTEGVRMQPGCVKAASNPQRIYGTQRLLYPMLQKGERGSDNWERITWDEAYALIAEKMQAAFDEYGPESVGFLSSYSGNSGSLSTVYSGTVNIPEYRQKMGIGPERFVQKTGASLFTATGDFAGIHMLYSVLQLASNSPEDMVNAKNIYLFANTCDAFRIMWSCAMAAKEGGSKLVVIDPRYSNSAAHADQWIPIRPGTDNALLLAACNYIIDNDLIDHDYLRNNSVAPLLVKEDGSYLRLSDLGMDPVDVNGTAMDTEVVYDEATGTFGSSREIQNPAIEGKFDANGIAVRPVYDLVRENIKPFDVDFAVKECDLPKETIEGFAKEYADGPSAIIYGWGFQHYRNSWRMYYAFGLLASLTGNACKPGAFLGTGAPATPFFKTPVMNAQAALTVEGGKLSKLASYNRIPHLVESGKWNGEDYTLRMLWIAGANPIECGIGYTEQIEAWKKVDFVVAASEYMTDTTAQASLALPVTMSFESEDFMGNFMNQKAIDPIGESKSDFEIFVGLAEAMGYDDLYDKDAEGYLRELMDTEENIANGLGYDEFHEKGAIYNDPIVFSTSVGVEYNATGRTQFYVESLLTNGNWDVEIDITDRMPSYEHAFEAYADNPLREKYPLFGISYHDNYTGHSMHNNVPWLNELRGLDGPGGPGGPYTVIHETAAAERGIKTGDKIRVFNDRGGFVCKALVSKGIREDTVTIPRGYAGREMEEGHLQSVTSIEARDDITNNDSHNDWLCQVEKI